MSVLNEAVDLLLFQLKAAHPGVELTPIPEYGFAIELGRRWRFDLAWPSEMVAVEVDGGSWVGGRHTSGVGFEKDAEKMSEAAILGWRVLRCTPRQVESGQVLGWLERIFRL